MLVHVYVLFIIIGRPPRSTVFPSTTLFRSVPDRGPRGGLVLDLDDLPHGQTFDDGVGHSRCDLRSEEHTSELQSRGHLVCRLLLEKKKKNKTDASISMSTQVPRPTSVSAGF